MSKSGVIICWLKHDLYLCLLYMRYGVYEHDLQVRLISNNVHMQV